MKIENNGSDGWTPESISATWRPYVKHLFMAVVAGTLEFISGAGRPYGKLWCHADRSKCHTLLFVMARSSHSNINLSLQLGVHIGSTGSQTRIKLLVVIVGLSESISGARCRYGKHWLTNKDKVVGCDNWVI